MHPILFHLGSFPVGTYGLLLAIAFFAGSWLAQRQAKLDGIPSERISDLAIALLLAGVIGAKLLMILVGLLTPAGQEGAMTFRDIFTLGTLRAGGAIHGGVIAGAATFFWKVRKAGLKTQTVGDAMVPGLALGQAIGRLGCFSAGCCYGTACSAPWAVTFTNPMAQQLSGTPLFQAIHPVQLYTFLANLAVMGLLLFLRHRRAFHGQILSAYFMLEGVQRLVVETWRGDLDRGAWLGLSWLSTGRLTALGFLAFGLILWILWKRQPKAEAAV
jgi:phosphatidylglycerol:prolipoprotein diacylglycerol transferase